MNCDSENNAPYLIDIFIDNLSHSISRGAKIDYKFEIPTDMFRDDDNDEITVTLQFDNEEIIVNLDESSNDIK